MVWVLQDHLIPSPPEAEQTRFSILSAVEMPEQNTIINQPLLACKDEKLMVLFLTVLFQIKHPRDQNFPLKSRVMDMLPKNPNTTEQNAAFPGGKAPELWISWLVGQGRQHLRAG